MGDRIKINCKKVYDSGMNYINVSEEIVNIQKRLDGISEKVHDILGGAPGNNFIVSFNKHIKDFDAVINFLGDNGTLLKRNALEHGNIDGIFATQMERSELDEQEL